MTRLIILTSAFALAASAAMAGDSVIHVKSKIVGAGSVITVDCSECPPLKPKYTGPDVHGVEIVEQHIGGEKKVVQTDNMMGGSAVRIVRASAGTKNYAGESVVHANGGTNVSDRHEGTIHLQPGQRPVVADSGVTYKGGGEFNVEEVGEDQRPLDGVDGGSQTSSVNMNDAEHDVVEPQEPGGEEPHNNGPEIIELRPSK
ncbi:plant virulence effector HPE1-like domain-containing protein [Hoeflea sp. TYP-13]|uniref:plant virulence effector HPE1-like domain-containing protein n=1 Tax=Hoeflea sp. TYP-13 TaxID=3230023 RepID=UPI0034C61E5B